MVSNPSHFVHVKRWCLQKNPSFAHLTKGHFFWDTLQVRKTNIFGSMVKIRVGGRGSRKFWPEAEILGIFSIEVAPQVYLILDISEKNYTHVSNTYQGQVIIKIRSVLKHNLTQNKEVQSQNLIFSTLGSIPNLDWDFSYGPRDIKTEICNTEGGGWVKIRVFNPPSGCALGKI